MKRVMYAASILLCMKIGSIVPLGDPLFNDQFYFKKAEGLYKKHHNRVRLEEIETLQNFISSRKQSLKNMYEVQSYVPIHESVIVYREAKELDEPYNQTVLPEYKNWIQLMIEQTCTADQNDMVHSLSQPELNQQKCIEELKYHESIEKLLEGVERDILPSNQCIVL